MPRMLLSTDDFRAAAKDGQRPDGTVFRLNATEPEVLGNLAARTVRFVFSDATVDHAGDSIDPKGWQLGWFKKNPVALFSHMSMDPPIGRASNVHVQGGQLLGDVEFAPPEVYDFADTIYRLVKGGFLKACSVGFRPDDWKFSSDKDRPFGIDFKKQTLLEISICPVPCNPNALGEARSAGIDTRPLTTWAERILDGGSGHTLSRRELDALRVQGASGARPRHASGRSHLVTRVGRRISAANQALIEEAIGHHEAATDCLQQVMGGEDAADNVDDTPTAEPPGSVAPKAGKAETREERIAHAAQVKRDIGRLTETPAQRREFVRQLRRSLGADGL